MAQYSKSLLVVKLAFFVAIFLSGGVSATRPNPAGDPVNEVGGWDMEKQYLEELGQYAVAAYNLKSPQQLTFQKGITKTYEAVVDYKPWMHFKKLISFKLC
ncbi:hypothetical protein LXL04_027001 [Taraxacum kok-saghyz]